MALRMHPVPAAQWQRLAATRRAYETESPAIDLLALEAESADPRRRMHAEVALIQVYLDALERQRASR